MQISLGIYAHLYRFRVLSIVLLSIMLSRTVSRECRQLTTIYLVLSRGLSSA